MPLSSSLIPTHCLFMVAQKEIISPSLYTSCQLKDLEILNLYEQSVDFVYEDNSSPSPVQVDTKILARNRSIWSHGRGTEIQIQTQTDRNIHSYIPHHKPYKADASHPMPLLRHVCAEVYINYL